MLRPVDSAVSLQTLFRSTVSGAAAWKLLRCRCCHLATGSLICCRPQAAYAAGALQSVPHQSTHILVQYCCYIGATLVLIAACDRVISCVQVLADLSNHTHLARKLQLCGNLARHCCCVQKVVCSVQHRCGNKAQRARCRCCS